MKPIRLLAAVSLLGLAGFAGAQINIPDPGAPGGSMDTAVRVVATSDLMVDRWISRWLRTHYPGWQADPHEFQEFAGERFAVVYITHPENPARRVYFRVVRSHADPDDSSPFPGF
jgi:hypothetical protein